MWIREQDEALPAPVTEEKVWDEDEMLAAVGLKPWVRPDDWGER